MDDLTKLEEQLEKLSGLFFQSINTMQRYAPLINHENEQNMEDSEMNVERIKYENIDDYQENKENYQGLIDQKSREINDTFQSMSTILNNFKKDEEYMKPEEELIRSIKSLKESNDSKIKNLNDKIKQTEDIINNIKKENELNMHILRYNINLDFNS